MNEGHLLTNSDIEGSQMEPTVFLRPVFNGGRFDNHSIPLSVLKDIAALEDMIKNVARWKFLGEHPDRRRVPRGFSNSIELQLLRIEDGSAIPVIGYIAASIALIPSGSLHYHLEARDAIIGAVHAAEYNEDITEYLPEYKLGFFDKIGRELHAGESIELTVPDKHQTATITREIRNKLLHASSTLIDLTDIADIRGSIPEADQDDMTFEIQLLDGGKITSPLPPEHKDDILRAFNEYSDGRKVLIHGVAKFSRSGKLKGVESIDEIVLLDHLDFRTRVEELKSLDRNWFQDQSNSIQEGALEWLASSFEEKYPEDIPSPCIYPVPEGGIQIEWVIPPWDVSIEINLIEHTGFWHRLNHNTQEVDVKELNFNHDEDWLWFSEQLRMIAVPE